MQRRRGARVAYLALTRTSAERILWPKLLELNERLGLGLKFNIQKLTATAPNGSVLHLLGADKGNEIEKLRGQAWDLVGIDEAASFRPLLLQYLVHAVIDPALVDYDGSLALFGTPGAACAGMFHDVCTKGADGWEVHSWTMLDNPHLPRARQWLERKRQQEGWAEDNPTYLREYLGQWVRDLDALVYRYDPLRNGLDAMPDGYKPDSPRWAHVIGIDYGYVDATAWAAWAHRHGDTDDRNAYAVESFKWPNVPKIYTDGLGIDPTQGLLASDAAEITRRLIERYGPWSVRGDAGGLGKPYIAEANRRFNLPIKAAEKSDKLGQIELFDDGLRTARTKFIIENNRDYIDEMQVLQWALEKVEVTVGGLVKHEDRKCVDPRFEDHVCAAGRYGYFDVRAYTNEAVAAAPTDPAQESPWAFDRKDEAGWLEAQNEREWWDN